MAIDLKKFYEITLERMLEAAKYQKAMCGKVVNLEKQAQANVSSTAFHSALTYMDMFTQDYLMIPIFAEFPHLVPLVEESTGMKKIHQDNKSDDVLIIDPIDGTAMYCKGEKDYSMMVGLLNQGKMVLGIGCYPETREIYAAIRGEGAWKIDPDGRRHKLPTIDKSKVNSKSIDAHYRFLEKPFNLLSDRLKDKGYTIGTNNVDFGTNLSGILRTAKGESCAFICSHTTLHDFGVPSLIVEELEGVVRVFGYSGKNDTENWTPTDDVFRGLDPKGTIPRFRVIIANNDATVDRLLRDMYH